MEKEINEDGEIVDINYIINWIKRHCKPGGCDQVSNDWCLRLIHEIKAAERRGAENMIDVLKCLKPFIDNGSFTTICDHCMVSKEVWNEWEKLK